MTAALEVAPAWFARFVRAALLTAMRRGELMALTWADVDTRADVLTVQAQHAKSRSTRRVPISSALHAVLAECRGDVIPMPSVHVFTGGHGSRLNPNVIEYEWRKLVKSAGIEDFHFHDCRHDAASRMVSAGVPLGTIQQLLGHSNPSMTMRYAHLAPDAAADAMERLS
jgi:integrase